MKVILFSVAVFGIHSLLASSKVVQGRLFKGPSFCLLRSDEGPCRAYFENWYYDAPSGECEKFIYGGCQGNKNRFETKTECERICKGIDKMTKQSEESNTHKSSLDTSSLWDQHNIKLFNKKWMTRKRRALREDTSQKQKGNDEANSKDFQQKDPVRAILGDTPAKQSSDPAAPSQEHSDPHKSDKQVGDSRTRNKGFTKNQSHKNGKKPIHGDGDKASKVNVARQSAGFNPGKQSHQHNSLPGRTKIKPPALPVNSGNDETKNGLNDKTTSQKKLSKEKTSLKKALKVKENNGEVSKTENQTPKSTKNAEQIDQVDDKNNDDNDDDHENSTFDRRPSNSRIKNKNSNGNRNTEQDPANKEIGEPRKPIDNKKGDVNANNIAPTLPNSVKTTTRVSNSDVKSDNVTRLLPTIAVKTGDILPTSTSSANSRQIGALPKSNKTRVSQVDVTPTPTIDNQNPREAKSSVVKISHSTTQATTVPTTVKNMQSTNEPVKTPNKKTDEKLTTESSPTASEETKPSKPVNNSKKIKEKKPHTTALPSPSQKPEPTDGSDETSHTSEKKLTETATALPTSSKKTEPNEGSEDKSQISNHEDQESNRQIRPIGDEEVHSSSHFAAFFLSSIVAVFAVYFIYHNRQKIVAIVIEGRTVSPRRGAGYRKLETNVEEAMPTMKKYVA